MIISVLLFTEERWLVDKILIKESEYAVHEYVFPCYQWIQADQNEAPVMAIKCAGIG